MPFRSVLSGDSHCSPGSYTPLSLEDSTLCIGSKIKHSGDKVSYFEVGRNKRAVGDSSKGLNIGWNTWLDNSIKLFLPGV